MCLSISSFQVSINPFKLGMIFQCFLSFVVNVHVGIHQRERKKKNKGFCVSKILVETEIATVLAWTVGLVLVGAARRVVVCGGFLGAGHDAGFLVVADAFLEEVSFAREGDALHEVERVGGVVEFRVAEGDEESVGDEFNVLLHQGGVHAEQAARQGFCQEFLFDHDGFGDDVLHRLLRGPIVQVGEEQAGEIGVQALVPRDEFVAEGKTRHEAAFFQPED